MLRHTQWLLLDKFILVDISVKKISDMGQKRLEIHAFVYAEKQLTRYYIIETQRPTDEEI